MKKHFWTEVQIFLLKFKAEHTHMHLQICDPLHGVTPSHTLRSPSSVADDSARISTMETRTFCFSGTLDCKHQLLLTRANLPDCYQSVKGLISTNRLRRLCFLMSLFGQFCFVFTCSVSFSLRH